MTELVTAWQKKYPLPPKPVVITFDDGYLDNYIYAFPILKQYKLKATLFVVTETIGKTNIFDQAWIPKNKMADWSQLKEMANSGIEIGSHTLDHPKLTQLSSAEALYQIRESKRKIESILFRPVSVFSYPHGDFNHKIAKLVQRSGYRAAVTVNRGIATPGKSRYKMKRISVNGGYCIASFISELERFKQPRWRGRTKHG
ncbi:MAG: polysaccharide deacetylase family protein [Bacillota bacterium]|jgi:peptidoglycan/xylan/chitin deacetylase (PgdA/CDA1 family)